jgi:hypothetical protein
MDPVRREYTTKTHDSGATRRRGATTKSATRKKERSLRRGLSSASEISRPMRVKRKE